MSQAKQLATLRQPNKVEETQPLQIQQAPELLSMRQALNASCSVNSEKFAYLQRMIGNQAIRNLSRKGDLIQTQVRSISIQPRSTELIRQLGKKTILQRAETDTIPGRDKLIDTQSDVNNKVNNALITSRANAGTPPAGRSVAEGVMALLGSDQQVGRTAIEVWVRNNLKPPKTFQPSQGSTKYAGVSYGLWRQPWFPILNPTMKINGIYIGSDKLGHFFQQGMTFRDTADSKGKSVAEEESELSEGGGFGLKSTGVFSNADQEANRQGGNFYYNLIRNPTMKFEISHYISSKWSEVENPNFYEPSVGHQVWANLLRGQWTGSSWGGTRLIPERLSVSLTPVGTSPVVTGTLRLGRNNHGTLRGKINYRTQSVRAPTIFGKTNANPISRIHLAFDWQLGSEAGKGYLDSSGERQLIGRWGRRNSDTNRNDEMKINKT